MIPATAGLGIQVIALFIYAQLSLGSGLWLVVAGSVVNGIGASAFFPANNSAVMKASPPPMLGISSGMLRTFGNVGMVFSFAVAILTASRSISRGLAFAIFVGTTSLHGALAAAFTTGLHAAFYTLMAFMVLAAGLSATRARSGCLGAEAVGSLSRPHTPDLGCGSSASSASRSHSTTGDDGFTSKAARRHHNWLTHSRPIGHTVATGTHTPKEGEAGLCRKTS